jgi:hypothetical protein
MTIMGDEEEGEREEKGIKSGRGTEGREEEWE